MSGNLFLRQATPAEQGALEDLQRRASLMWDEYRATLLENPDAIELPTDQITGGNTIVAEKSGKTLGFAGALPRSDGNAELDGLFVEPEAWRMGVGHGLID
jgi:GNAT superfamily N-acetyltransferase